MTATSPSSLAWNPETKEHPFTYPDADVILISYDGVEFRVHKVILALASSFFRTMFTLPQPPVSAHDSPDKPAIACASRDIPVVDVAERSAVIYHLLLLLYPIRDLAPISLENLRDALAASLKYDIEKATDVLSSRLALLVKDTPLRVYAIACMFELEDVAKLAVKEVRQQKVYLGDSDFPELDRITAGAYHRLLEYCKKGGAVEGFSFVHPLKASSLCVNGVAPANDISRSVLPRNAPHPFDRSDADVILCSSDLIHFHVHSTVLRIISPFFPDELEKLNLEPSIPPGGSESVDPPKSTHLISLTEDSATISSLLSAYYDILLGDTLTNARIIQTLDKSWTLFSAAKKYGMQRAIKLLRADLLAFTTKRPFSVFMLASRLNYSGIGIKAARQSLRGGLSSYLPEMEDIPAKRYYHLWGYRRRCQKVAHLLSTNIAWLGTEVIHSFDPPIQCHSYQDDEYVMPCWVSPLMEHVRASDILKSPIVCPLKLEAAKISSDCSYCQNGCADEIRRFGKQFNRFFEKEISEVELRWD